MYFINMTFNTNEPLVSKCRFRASTYLLNFTYSCNYRNHWSRDCLSCRPSLKPTIMQIQRGGTGSEGTMSEEERRGRFEESMNRRKNECLWFQDNKDTGYQRFRDEHGHIQNYCRICSEHTSKLRPVMKVVRHKHFSTLVYRQAAPVDKNGNYPCFHCERTPHSFRMGSRYAILLTSSTLHMWQGRREFNHYKGNEIHMDESSIPGGTIGDLRHALSAEYSNTYRSLDVLVVCGINDVLREKTTQEVLAEFRGLQETVHALAPAGQQNSIAIATLIIPQKIASLKDRGVDSNLTKMVAINDGIKELNRSQPQGSLPVKFAPLFHTWGMAGRRNNIQRPRNLLGTMIHHRASQWRETEANRRLHLSDATRLRMGRTCVGYFKALYGVTPCRAGSKEEGIRLEGGNQREESRFHAPWEEVVSNEGRYQQDGSHRGRGGRGRGRGHGEPWWRHQQGGSHRGRGGREREGGRGEPRRRDQHDGSHRGRGGREGRGRGHYRGRGQR